MRIIRTSTLFFGLLLIGFGAQNVRAQGSSVTVKQDPKFAQLLNEKIKMNSSITVNDRYKIQIYNGESETAKRTLSDFRRDNKNYDGTIVFNTPTYKVWIGNFKTRIEAERNLAEVRKRYPIAFLIKPNK